MKKAIPLVMYSSYIKFHATPSVDHARTFIVTVRDNIGLLQLPHNEIPQMAIRMANENASDDSVLIFARTLARWFRLVCDLRMADRMVGVQ